MLGVQTNVLTLLVLYALAWAYLTYTKGGRTIYAVGSNREAARTAGLSVLFYSVAALRGLRARSRRSPRR